MASSSSISVILPIRNEKKYIKDLLDSLIEQLDQLKDEIIISDGDSNDGTKKIIEKYQNNYSFIKLVKNKDRIVPIGFNKALSISTGDLIIRLDGHLSIDSNFIKNSMAAMKKYKYDCIGGSTIHSSKTNIGKIISIGQSSIFGIGSSGFRKKLDESKFVDTLAFGVYHREVFSEIGGYDEELIRNQDDEFNFRLTQKGGKIFLDKLIISYYFNRGSLNKLFKQYFQYGFYKVRVFQKRRSFASIRHLVPLLFVLAIFFSILDFFYLSMNFSNFLLILYIPYIFCASIY